MNCIPEDDAHTEECIKGTNRCDDDFYSHETESNYASIGNETPDHDYEDTAPHNEPTLDDFMLGDPEEYDDSGGEADDTPADDPVTSSHTFIRIGNRKRLYKPL